MLRIVIYTGNEANSQKIFAIAQDAVKSAKVMCELSYAKTAEKIIDNLSASPTCYDVLLLDALDEKCKKIAGAVRKSNINATIVFFSNNDINNVLNVMKYRPSGVVVMPCKSADVADTIKAAISEQLSMNQWFTVKTKELIYRIPYASIIYFESSQRKAVLHTDKQIIEFYGKLNDVTALLPAEMFARCHQSYIINFSKVRRLDKTERSFTMVSGDVIEISKSHYSQVVQAYEAFVDKN
ncbi:MAG: LytTR family transcriptional regulator DNA-binding domain-containing protein [Clostridia bacterium]|nr:LytTR family transcriptional regulator DNA-binding domain-containing protein [Clostridia bacterium]MBQ7120738.1 LytTR family transcriptional regulator DNA-binding domain-containing protein [Clostridia bacterium]